MTMRRPRAVIEADIEAVTKEIESAQDAVWRAEEKLWDAEAELARLEEEFAALPPEGVEDDREQQLWWALRDPRQLRLLP